MQINFRHIAQNCPKGLNQARKMIIQRGAIEAPGHFLWKEKQHVIT